MPLLQYSFPRNAYSPDLLGRGYALAFPVDWIREGGWPLILVFHGGGQSPKDFLDDSMFVKTWFDGTWTGTPVPADADKIKAFVLAPQGISVDDDLGGDWNAGNMGTLNRYAAVNDEQFVIDAIGRAEADFQTQYGVVKNLDDPQRALNIEWFDRRKLFIIGFSEGGQMAYRMAERLRREGWTVKGLAVFSSSVGGWYSEERRAANLPRDVDWTPDMLQTNVIHALRTPSLLHVHGALDDRVEPLVDGPSITTIDVVTSQMLSIVAPEPYMRSDVSGKGSAQSYVDLCNGGLFNGVAGAFPAAVPPAGLGAQSFAWTWADATGSRQVVFSYVLGLGHVVPTWGPAALLQFFQAGGL